MPPTRRTSNTPQPRGRRPKVAGTGKAPARPTTPIEDAAAATAPVDAPEAGSTEVAAAQLEKSPAEPVGTVESGGGNAPVSSEVEPDAAPTSKPDEGAERVRVSGSGVSAGEVSADGASAEDANATGEDTPAGDTAAGRRRVVVVGAVALALAGFAVVAAFKPGGDIANEAWVDTAATSRVSADARHAVETLYTYKFDTVDEDFDKARAVLTDSMRTEFDKTAQVTRDAVVQTKTATSAQVSDIGVKLIDGDNAELVGSMTVSATNDGAAQGSAQGPLSVTMKKVGDTWLLSDIRDR